METLLPFLALLLAALGIALVAARAKVPYTVALVLFGLVVGVITQHWTIPGLAPSVRSLFAPNLFFDLFLPPIVFEAALHIHAGRLRARVPLILFLVFVGVVFTTLFTGYLLFLVAGVPLAAALLLAAILSPTDPIAVVDLFRRLKVPRELSTIVESESILNDAIGVILFVVLVGIVTGGAISAGAVAFRFLWLIVGGLGVGALTAGLVYVGIRPLKDPVATTALSVVAAYGSFLVATDLGASGILATAIAGLAVGTWIVPNLVTEEEPGALAAFWSVIVYLANSVIFLAMGLLFGASGLVGVLPLIALVFLLITLGRAIFVYAHRPLVRAMGRPGATLPAPWYHLLALSGVRGAIPVVLVLSVEASSTTLSSGGVQTVVATVLGVVLVSLLVNNLAAEWYAAVHFGAEGSAAGPGPRVGGPT
jgi:CPA1 family monovalent cation:H+ antiporter